MNPLPDNRQYSRRTAYIIAEYTVLEGIFRDKIKNIGAGGLFIRTDRKIAVGQPISIRFPLFNFDKTLHASGRVVRRDPDGFAVTFTDTISGLICKKGHFPEIFHEGEQNK
ncbi:MAG: PilZ domain-containing protein [Desulfosarcina sp.]|nr:PilZ domain-containing protein [Desulfosarcina sp.]